MSNELSPFVCQACGRTEPTRISAQRHVCPPPPVSWEDLHTHIIALDLQQRAEVLSRLLAAGEARQSLALLEAVHRAYEHTLTSNARV